MSHISSENSYHHTGFIEGTRKLESDGKEKFYISGVDSSTGIEIQTKLTKIQKMANALSLKTLGNPVWIPVATNQGPLYMKFKECKKVLEDRSPFHARLLISNFSLPESTKVISDYIRANFITTLPAKREQFLSVETRSTPISRDSIEEAPPASPSTPPSIITEEYVTDCPFPELREELARRPLTPEEVKEKNDLGLSAMEYRTAFLFSFKHGTIHTNPSLKTAFKQMQRGAVIKSLNSIFSKVPGAKILTPESTDEEIKVLYRKYRKDFTNKHENFSFITQIYNQWQ